MNDESAEDLYENAPCGYLSAMPDGGIVRVNATFLRWTGYRREDLVGVKRFQDLLTVGGRIYHETHYAPLLRMQGTVREIAVEIVGADGRRLPVLVNSVLVRDAAGAPQVVRTTIFDATERKGYERELLVARDRERAARRRTERLQRITAQLAAAPDAGAIAAAVIDELDAAFGAERACLAISDARTGELVVVERRGELELRPGSAGLFEASDVVRLPLVAAPGTDGWLWLGFSAPRSFDAEERAFLLACAGQAALALERARLDAEVRNVALSLQRSLLGAAPPPDPRFELATRYQPADEHLEVGGDWHDAFKLARGRVGIVVGDVVGRGLAAASAMGQLRSAVRALAGADLEPAAILRHLDTFVEQVEPARYATVAYADVDPDSGRVVLASAGHPPPVLLAPGRPPELFAAGRSLPLGIVASGVGRVQATFELAPGGGLLLYTDGLVERRTEPIDVGLERLLAALRDRPGASPARLAAELPAALLEDGAGEDDVCLLSLRRASGGVG
jgi:PAS domain S-box-containing protein